MEDLYFNPDAAFTKWIVADGLLHEPFVLADVGVQGDVHLRWKPLERSMIVHGFDAIEEVVRELKRDHVRYPNRHFHNIALGQTDGERTFYFNAANPTASSMYSQGPSRYDRVLSEQARTVPVRRLDTLFADGTIPRADFLKVDVEGFEQDVFLGAKDFIAAGVLGIETESNFGVSSTYPKGHFPTISEIMTEHGFTVFDLGFNRVPRASFLRALARRKIDPLAGVDVGRPATLNVLFCRDLIEERDEPQNYRTPPADVGVDQIIKMMIICELYGLNDHALDTAESFAQKLSARFDVERAVDLLTTAELRPAHESAAYRLRAIERSTSWRITAPMRAAKRFFSGG